jgi:putative transposase
MARPPRIEGFNYNGPLTIFFTICTRSRHAALAAPDVARQVSEQLLLTATQFHLEVSAYCVMPHHAHVILNGPDEPAETLKAVNRWKQKTGYRYRQRTREFLWQPGYWDRVLRAEDDLFNVICYVVANPLRAGLVDDVTKYPWVGASRWTIQDLAGACQDCERPNWW